LCRKYRVDSFTLFEKVKVEQYKWENSQIQCLKVLGKYVMYNSLVLLLLTQCRWIRSFVSPYNSKVILEPMWKNFDTKSLFLVEPIYRSQQTYFASIQSTHVENSFQSERIKTIEPLWLNHSAHQNIRKSLIPLFLIHPKTFTMGTINIFLIS
jgi:hypothetical protein